MSYTETIEATALTFHKHAFQMELGYFLNGHFITEHFITVNL